MPAALSVSSRAADATFYPSTLYRRAICDNVLFLACREENKGYNVLFWSVRKIDLTGKRFGRLTVVREADRGIWWCRCKCSKDTEVRGCYLRRGSTQSCGCLRRDPLTFQGIERSISEWAAFTGIRRETIYSRLRAGWSIEDVLKRPVAPQLVAKKDDAVADHMELRS